MFFTPLANMLFFLESKTCYLTVQRKLLFEGLLTPALGRWSSFQQREAQAQQLQRVQKQQQRTMNTVVGGRIAAATATTGLYQSNDGGLLIIDDDAFPGLRNGSGGGCGGRR